MKYNIWYTFLIFIASGLSLNGELVIDESFDYEGEAPMALDGKGYWSTSMHANLIEGAFTQPSSGAGGLALQLHAGMSISHPLDLKSGVDYYFSYVGRLNKDYEPASPNARFSGVYFKTNLHHGGNSSAVGFVNGKFGVSAGSNGGSGSGFVAASGPVINEISDYVVVGKIRVDLVEGKYFYQISSSVYQWTGEVPSTEPPWAAESTIRLGVEERDVYSRVFFHSSTGGSSCVFDSFKLGTRYTDVTNW